MSVSGAEIAITLSSSTLPVLQCFLCVRFRICLRKTCIILVFLCNHLNVRFIAELWDSYKKGDTSKLL